MDYRGKEGSFGLQMFQVYIIIEKPSESEYQNNEPDFTKLIPDDGLLLEHLKI